MKKPLPPSLSDISSWLRQQWQVIVFIICGAALRLYNFHNSLYFIYDQGRDALVWDKMVHGNLVLVGPTTGLGGFFLGPLWYYVGLPVFVLSGGNPFAMGAIFIAITCLALPLYWWLGHALFRSKFWAVTCAIFLAIIPGSIQASIFIWNIIMAAPLMLGALYSFSRAREARRWLALGFFLVALTLQSEFAYAVFYLPVLFVLIPWLRQRRDWRDFAVAILAVGVTGIPQMLFELRNRFIMTTSLLHSMSDKSQSVTWTELWAQRPQQLLATSSELLIGGNPRFAFLTPILLALFVVGLLVVARTVFTRSKSREHFLWQLTALFAFIPYPFFMMWRGNHGYFFSYYITCHFVFLVPVVVLGIQKIGEWMSVKGKLKVISAIVVGAFLASWFMASAQHWLDTVAHPENNAGLAKMVSAIETLYRWQNDDHAEPFVVRTYTANVYTEQYDYLLKWYGESHHRALPRTVNDPSDHIWYILIESKKNAQPIFFEPWYQTATASGQKVREQQIGVLTLEAWKK